MDTALEAILSFGGDRRITLFNAAAERMFLWDARDALGKPVDQFFLPPFDLDVVPRTGVGGAVEAEGPAGGRSPIREAVGVRANGEEFPVEFSLSALELRNERVYTLIARDISARRRAEEALRAQATSLANTTEELRVLNEELNQRTLDLEHAMGARSRFYASMSHELRTPINAILGYTSLLLDRIYGPINEQQENSLQRTHKAAQHLLELVNDVLDLSKIEAGKVELQVEKVGFPELIQDLFVTVRPIAEQRGTQVEMEGPEEPFTITSDARRVRQILLNLLSNAIKFGEGKPVRVRCSRTADGGVVVEVIDRGKGIAPEDQEKIFDEFVQLEHENGAQGTGLGLPISRRLAELLGGTLTVSSAVEEGSVFRLTLPPVDPDLQEAQEDREKRLAASR